MIEYRHGHSPTLLDHEETGTPTPLRNDVAADNALTTLGGPPDSRIILALSLAPGSRLGVYEITAPLGAGGMGEVCRATDTNLKRQVAIGERVAGDDARPCSPQPLDRDWMSP